MAHEQVVAFGTHDKLLKTSKIYQDLYTKESLNS